MNSTRSQAEAYAVGLIEGVVSVSEVVAWADTLISKADVPDEWMIDLASASNGTEKEVIALLHGVPGEVDRAEANRLVRSLLSRKNRPFRLFDARLLPKDFRYPEKLVAFANSGHYPFLPAVSFLDAGAADAEEVLKYVRRVRSDLVPFAQSEDRFPSLAAREPGDVYIVDIVAGETSKVGSFDSWLEDVDRDAEGLVYVRV